ncbi:hypothetical protein BH11PSE11_BH11PSE11_24340 [soil metagenome]
MISNTEPIEGASLAGLYAPVSKLVRPETQQHATDALPVTVACHENEVPPFAGWALERLYGNLYASLTQFEISGSLKGASTYIVRHGTRIVTLYLFRINKGRVEVLNEVIKVDEDEVRRFADYIFTRFPAAQLIAFRAVVVNINRLPYRHLRFNYLEDTVAQLPESPEAYLALLGKNVRRNLRRYQKSLEEHCPSYTLRFYEKDEVRDQDVLDIIALNRARMSQKQKTSDIDAAESARLLRLAKQGGLVGVATIEGRVCGGTIAYRAGENYFLLTLAHDPRYNQHSLGTLCCYLTICESIRRHQAREFHFLWGRYDYKTLFLGVRRDLDHLTIYRTPSRLLLNPGSAFKPGFRSLKRRAVLWYHAAKRNNSVAAKLVLPALMAFRKARGIKSTFFREN